MTAAAASAILSRLIRRTTARGIAILLGLGIAIAIFKGGVVLSRADVRWELTLAIAMFVIALASDAIELAPITKLSLQTIAVVAFAILGPAFRFLDSFGANASVMSIWLLMIANAFVLMDGLNGLAPAVGILAALGTATVADVNGHLITMVAALAMAGALAGFMLSDPAPATARIGNGGALAVGVVLGLLSVHASRDAHATWAPRLAIPLLIMMVPLIETMTVTMRGLAAERELDNAYHRLGRLGLTRLQSLVALVVLEAGATVAAVVIAFVPEHEAVMMLPYVALLFAVPVVFLMNQAFDAAEPRGTELSLMGRLLFAAGSRRTAVTIAMDLMAATAAFFGALLLRFDFDIPVTSVVKMLVTLPGVLIAALIAFTLTGIYRSSQASTAAGEAMRFAIAAVTAAVLAGLSSLPEEFIIPRGSCVVFAVLLFNLLLATRWSSEVLMRLARNFVAGAQRVVIIGADAHGEAAVNHLFTTTAAGIELLGIVDDDDFKRGKLFHGYPVLGSIEELGKIFDRTRFNEILIAQEPLAATQLSALQSFAASHQVSLRKFSLSFTEVEHSIGPGAMARAH
ncbi:MAG TPA: hypothetical protein VMA09_22870 [Candidatus Binataceae bacterium]|nr:hypothetical protein [Candidatus Binataceae bacterium]